MTSETNSAHSNHPEHAISIKLRAGLHHCDPLAVVWHGRYFEWMEQARTELFRSVDLAVPVLQAMGVKMFVVDTNCRYTAPVLYDQEVSVTAWFIGSSPLIRVAYDIHNLGSNCSSARATTFMASTDASGNLLTTTPQAILERLPVK